MNAANAARNAGMSAAANVARNAAMNVAMNAAANAATTAPVRPAAGWYPDPEGGVRLRWWDGEDWSDRYRSRPPASGYAATTAAAAAAGALAGGAGALAGGAGPVLASLRPEDRRLLVDEVRQAARSEMDRALDTVEARVGVAAQRFQPLVGAYTNQILRVVRRLALLALVLLIGYLVLQAVGQAAVLDWIGDRIDRLTER